MIKYQVRSKDLIDVVNEVKNRRLIMSPYFQRNLVWRPIHKIDFIKTILLGYPFPQIFIAKGNIDLVEMTNTSCIVDGQQRMNTIFEYVNGGFKVDNKFFEDLNIAEKQAFLKYQIPIIDLDIDNDAPEIIDIFQRLNRTFYSLSTIEQLSTEYATSEFMLLAKLLANEIKFSLTVEEQEEESLPLQLNPNIPSSFIDWSKDKPINYYNKLILNEGIFSFYELSRQVHLMFTLNLLATYTSDFYNRNEFVIIFLDEYKETYPMKDEALIALEHAANKILKLKLKKKSYWLNKANIFSIITLFAKHIDIIDDLDEKVFKDNLEKFEVQLPSDYQLSAKEAVNNKRERLIRNAYLSDLLFSSLKIRES